MRQGIKKFCNPLQGGRTTEGRKAGEFFVGLILNELGINALKLKFSPKDKKIKLQMTPDFIVKKNGTNFYILLESKYKQIAGSDWEKLESNWGFHTYYYNEICHENIKVVVILSGYWRECQKNLYPVFIEYAKRKYGNDCIFDFGESAEEIIRFAQFMGKKPNGVLQDLVKIAWEEHKKK